MRAAPSRIRSWLKEIMSDPPSDTWALGSAYERYVGRWSRPVSHTFLTWLAVPAGSAWLEVGCGTGALSQPFCGRQSRRALSASTLPTASSRTRAPMWRTRAPDEGVRFPLCRPDALRALFAAAGLRAIDLRPIDVPTVFESFDDYWSPFLGGQGPAPTYCMSLAEDVRVALRERLRASLPTDADGKIRLIARAFAVRATA
jgi:hypothetical protein